MQDRWLVSMFGSLAIAVGVGQFPPAARPNATAAAIAAASLSALQTPTDPLPHVCDPFGDLSTTRPVDNTCGLQGDPGASGGQQAQNRVKNNFCAHQNGDSATITRVTFDRLQTHTPSKATLPWGSRTAIPATDAARNALHNLHTTTNGDTVGEGSYVQFVGYILEGHFGGAESVNCDLNQRQTWTSTSRS